MSEDFFPSSANQWGNCSGYRRMVHNLPKKPESDDQKVGTATHWVISTALEDDMEAAQLLGGAAPNGVVIDEDIIYCANVMIDDVRSVRDKFMPMLVEQDVTMPQIAPGCRGKVDCAVWDDANGRVYVWDYKNGRRSTSPFENLQLTLYALGVMNHFSVTTDVEIVLRIVSPNVYHSTGPVQQWSIKFSALRYLLDRMREKTTAAPELTTGTWCRDCPGVGFCSAARKASWNAIDYANHAFEADDMSDEDIGIEYRLLSQEMKVIEKRLSELSDQITYRVNHGSKNTGYLLEHGRSKWVWKGSVDEAIAIASSFGVEAEKKSVKTVAQVRDAMPAAQRKAFMSVVNNFAENKRGGIKLVPAENTLGAKAFGRK